MKLELSQDEAHFLSKHLTRHIDLDNAPSIHPEQDIIQRCFHAGISNLVAVGNKTAGAVCLFKRRGNGSQEAHNVCGQ